MEKVNGRNMCILLYPDNKDHMKALEIIKKTYDFAGILHNKDVDENGELKKEHIHIVLNVGKNARWNTAIADELGIDARFVEKCGKIDRALEYLIHYNDIGKYQYDISEVFGNLKVRLNILINKNEKTEGEKVIELIEYIDRSVGFIATEDFARYCAINGKWDIFRRSGSIFIRMIDEHNERIKREFDEIRKKS